MDIGKFGMIIVLLGAIVAGYGAVEYMRAEGKATEDRIHNGGWENPQGTEDYRDEAKKPLIAGAIAIALGCALALSAKKKD